MENQKEVILLVDDELEIRQMILDYLRRMRITLSLKRRVVQKRLRFCPENTLTLSSQISTCRQ